MLGPETVQENAIELKQLVQDEGDSELTYRIGFPIVICVILSFFVFRNVRKEEKRFYYFSIIIGILSLFMATKYFPWRFMPGFMTMIQFPWRMIGIAVFFLAYVSSINLHLLLHSAFKKSKTENIVLSIFVVLTIISIIPIFKNLPNEHQELDINVEEYILNKNKIGIMAINREYLPAKSAQVNHEYINVRDEQVYILKGYTEIKSEEKENLKEIIEIENTTEETIIELPFVFYPGYEVILNQNEKLEIKESENGFVSVCLPKETKGTILVSYQGTVWMKISYIISFIGFIVLIVYIRRSKKDEITSKTRK